MGKGKKNVQAAKPDTKELRRQQHEQAIKAIEASHQKQFDDEKDFMNRYGNYLTMAALATPDDIKQQNVLSENILSENNVDTIAKAKEKAEQKNLDLTKVQIYREGMKNLAGYLRQLKLDDKNLLYTDQARKAMVALSGMKMAFKNDGLEKYDAAFKRFMGQKEINLLAAVEPLLKLEEMDLQERYRLVSNLDYAKDKAMTKKSLCDIISRTAMKLFLKNQLEADPKDNEVYAFFSDEQLRNDLLETFRKNIDSSLDEKRIGSKDLNIAAEAKKLIKPFKAYDGKKTDQQLNAYMGKLEKGVFAKKTVQMTMLRTALREAQAANKEMQDNYDNINSYIEKLMNLKEAADTYISYKEVNNNHSTTAESRLKAAKSLRKYAADEMNRVKMLRAIQWKEKLSDITEEINKKYENVEQRFMRAEDRIQKANAEMKVPAGIMHSFAYARNGLEFIKKQTSTMTDYTVETQQNLRYSGSLVAACLASANYSAWTEIAKYDTLTAPNTLSRKNTDNVSAQPQPQVQDEDHELSDILLNNNVSAILPGSEQEDRQNGIQNNSMEIRYDMEAKTTALRQKILEDRIDAADQAMIGIDGAHDLGREIVEAFGYTDLMPRDKAPSDFLNKDADEVADKMSTQMARREDFIDHEENEFDIHL